MAEMVTSAWQGQIQATLAPKHLPTICHAWDSLAHPMPPVSTQGLLGVVGEFGGNIPHISLHRELLILVVFPKLKMALHGSAHMEIAWMLSSPSTAPFSSDIRSAWDVLGEECKDKGQSQVLPCSPQLSWPWIY